MSAYGTPGHGCNVLVSGTVNRSTRLYCTECGKSLPMGTPVVFELTQNDKFVAVYCEGHEPFDVADQRHPFDLED